MDGAVANGHCEIRPRAKVHKLISDTKGAVIAAEYFDADGNTRQVNAKVFVVACQSIETCRLLLPLYQAQGSDGFFTVKRVGIFWLALSAMLRRAGIPRVMEWLPGVRPLPHREETLVINTRLARILPLQIFHLMGFRKRRWQGNLLLVSRRRHDAGGLLSPSSSGRT